MDYCYDGNQLIGCPHGVEEYCGYCGYHWLRLTDDQRKTLLENRAPTPAPAPIYKTENISYPKTTIHNPPRSRVLDFVLQVLATGIGLLVARFMFWH